MEEEPKQKPSQWETVGYARITQSKKSIILTQGGHRIGILPIDALNELLEGKQTFVSIIMPTKD